MQKSNLLLENENLKLQIELERLKQRRLISESESLEIDFKNKLVDFLLSLDYNTLYDDGREWYGIRYDAKKYKIGDELPNSKTNIERDDSREFPEYDSESYGDLPDLNGTSAYMFAHVNDIEELIDPDYNNDEEIKNNVTKFVDYIFDYGYLYTPDESSVPHINIISGTNADTESGEDDFEWIIEDPVVEYILY